MGLLYIPMLPRTNSPMALPLIKYIKQMSEIYKACFIISKRVPSMFDICIKYNNNRIFICIFALENVLCHKKAN